MAPPFMRRLRHLALATWIVLSLLVGQQAVLLHDLGHVFEKHEQGVPAEKPCDTHYLCAQLGSAVGATAPVIPPAAAPALPVSTQVLAGVAQRARLAYRSQAPPSAPA